MLPLCRILHPTDFSDNAVEAFWLAYALARDYGACVDILHVVTEPGVVLGEALTPSGPNQIPDTQPVELYRMQSEEPRVRINYQFVCGSNVADEIVRAAERTNASFIVMGTHGRRGLRRLFLGSVAGDVPGRSPCPVIAVNGPVKLVAPPGGAQSERFRILHRGAPCLQGG